MTECASIPAANDSRRRRTRRPALARQRRYHKGFTLIELLVTIAIVAIIATWAIPNFQAMISRHQVSSEAMRIRTALATARNTAITQATLITLCPSRDRQTCLSDWSAPLLVIKGQASGNQLDSDDDEILRVFDEGRGVSVSFRNNYHAIRIPANGWPRGYNGTFFLCGGQGVSASLVMNTAGRLTSGEAPSCD